MIAYSSNIDEAGVDANLTPVPDDTVRVEQNTFVVPKMNQIVGKAAFLGTTGVYASLQAPSTRRINPLYINPVYINLFPDVPSDTFWSPENPVALDVNEQLECFSNANPAAAEQHAVVAALADGKLNPIQGDIRNVRAVLNVAQVLNTWSLGVISFPDALPVGDYIVCGARAEIAGGIAFRFTPIGAVHRPGGLCAQDASQEDPYGQRSGLLGEWFRFSTVQPPTCSVLGSAAVAAANYNLYLDLIKA